MQQRVLLLQIDELLDPDNPALTDQRNELTYQIQQSIKPPVLAGPGNQLKAIRDSYIHNKIALQLEHLPVSNQTPSLEFWQYLTTLNNKYKTTANHDKPAQ